MVWIRESISERFWASSAVRSGDARDDDTFCELGEVIDDIVLLERRY